MTGKPGAAAYLSLAIAMTFCHSALADSLPAHIPTFAEPARSLGTYRITDIASNWQGSFKSICGPPAQGEKPQDGAEQCGKHVWLVRTETQLAVLAASAKFDESTSVETALLDGMFIHRKCDFSLKHDPAIQGGLFSGDFCRAYLSKPSKTAAGATEKFVFSSRVPELAAMPSDYNIFDMFSIAFLSIEINAYTIEIPRGEASPKTVKIIQDIDGVIIGIPGGYKNVFTLTNVPN